MGAYSQALAAYQRREIDLDALVQVAIESRNEHTGDDNAFAQALLSAARAQPLAKDELTQLQHLLQQALQEQTQLATRQVDGGLRPGTTGRRRRRHLIRG